MADYAEIEDRKALARLNRELASKSRTALRHAERRDIGWPAGRLHAHVRFRSGSSTDVFWWTGRKRDDGATVVNLFGHGTPDDSVPLNIDVQCDLPTEALRVRPEAHFSMEDKQAKRFSGIAQS